MSSRDNRLLLEDMLDAANKIMAYTKGYTYDEFLADNKTIDAVIRNFEIIGEAAARIDPDFQLQNQEVPWKVLRGYRNRLIHEYFGVDYQIVWEIIENEVQSLIEAIEAILND